jgi:shikimate kinase
MNKIIITGFMGSGKSSVAQVLGQLLNYEPVDLDKLIELEEGRSVREVIESDGEPRFRELEQQALSKVLGIAGKHVVALGGGAWISEANRQLIKKQAAMSIWLDAPFNLCWKRITLTAEQRPLARTQAAALKLFSERTSSYQLADLRVVVTEKKSAAELATEILETLAKHPS